MVIIRLFSKPSPTQLVPVVVGWASRRSQRLWSQQKANKAVLNCRGPCPWLTWVPKSGVEGSRGSAKAKTKASGGRELDLEAISDAVGHSDLPGTLPVESEMGPVTLQTGPRINRMDNFAHESRGGGELESSSPQAPKRPLGIRTCCP